MIDDINKQLAAVEAQMNDPHLWDDKERAQAIIQEYETLKARKEGKNAYDVGPALMSIIGGAGGLDAEDFAYILLTMYEKFIMDRGWSYVVLHKNENEHGGIRNITFEVIGKGAYGTLKHESGVHRLVRISPFNARKQRHTSFALVEVLPKLPPVSEVEINEDDLDVQFTRSSGPGGQNVNKRETAVRIVHKSTNIAVHVDSERSQAQNKERALELLRGKLFKKFEEDRRRLEQGLSPTSDTSIEWGSQIRSYVLHPYKLVKDHRTDVEVRDVESVLEGDIEPFIAAFEKSDRE